MKVKIYDEILDSYKAEEMAKDMGMSEIEAAETWFNETAYEMGTSISEMPVYSKFIKDIGEGKLYYDYGAGYYFLVDTNNTNESKTNKNMKKNIVRLNETQLNKIVAESVKRVLSEGMFGGKIIDSNQAFNYWNKMAQKYGYEGIRFRNGQISYVTQNRNGESVECPTKIALPKPVTTGMFGTGTQGYDPKSYQMVTQQLQALFGQMQRIHNEFMEQDAQNARDMAAYQDQKARSPEAIQKQREKRWAQDAETERQWRNQRQLYRPTGEINDYRG